VLIKKCDKCYIRVLLFEFDYFFISNGSKKCEKKCGGYLRNLGNEPRGSEEPRYRFFEESCAAGNQKNATNSNGTNCAKHMVGMAKDLAGTFSNVFRTHQSGCGRWEAELFCVPNHRLAPDAADMGATVRTESNHTGSVRRNGRPWSRISLAAQCSIRKALRRNKRVLDKPSNKPARTIHRENATANKTIKRTELYYGGGTF